MDRKASDWVSGWSLLQSSHARSSAATILLFAFFLATAAAETKFLTDEHVDLRISYDSANVDFPLSIRAFDGDAQIIYAPEDVVFVAPEAAKYTLPGGTPFGNEGDPLWILPQSQNPTLLYIGVSAEGLPGSVFSGTIDYKLISVEGPGDFFAWQASQFGGIQVRMNSRDGISDEDKTTPLVGSHEHLNWGFSTNGVYKVTFQASGRRSGESTNVLSAPAQFTFHVLPLPDVPETPFQEWQREQFGIDASEDIKGPAADPDLDDFVNVVEYAFGMNPTEPDGSLLPRMVLLTENNVRHVAVEYPRVSRATDIEYVIEAKDTVGPGEWTVVYSGTSADPNGTDSLIRWQDPTSMEGRRARFYRITVRLE